jgi:gamma-F420-2:alpha-L-glutamate ligase
MVDSSFYRNSQVSEALTMLQNETVIKAVDGHGGSQVFLINERQNNNPEEGIETLDYSGEEMDGVRQYILNGIGSSDVVIQPFTGSRCQDLRVYVIGKEIIAAVLRTAASGFKSNYSLGGEVRLYELSEQELVIVNIIIDEFDFGLVGIDFIIGDNGELIFNEIEDVVGARMLYQTSEINIVERYLSYIYAVVIKN